MDELTLKTFVAGELYNNCYLIFSEKSKKGFIVDSPAPSRELDEYIQNQDLEIIFIALTHAHFDHIASLDNYSTPFYIHKDDLSFLRDPNLNGSAFFSSSVIIKRRPYFYQDGQLLRFGEHNIEVIHSPGHTPGSVSLKLNDWLFSGDTIFLDSVGRTDIPLASHDTIIESIKNRILTLPPETLIYPGHGPLTTVEREKKHNPFLESKEI